MAKSYASTVIEAPAEDVWARIRDFNGLATWHAGLESFVPDPRNSRVSARRGGG